MKKILLLSFILASTFAKAQKIDQIFVNLYTDSLKKGTYNYINIDGLLSNGNYTPLDSTDLIFTSSAGKFFGNSLWLDKDSKVEKVDFKIELRKNPSMVKAFTMYVKRQEDGPLKTLEEIMEQKPVHKKH